MSGLTLSSENAPAAAGAAVVLTVGVVLTNTRFAEKWAAFPQFAILAVAALAVLALLFATENVPGEGASAWQSILIVTGLVLVFGTLTQLADVLGTDTGNSRTLFWVSGLFAAGAAGLAWNFRSGVALLFAALAAIVSVVSFVDWVFTPESEKAFRWVLAVLSVGLLAAGAAKRSDDERQGAQLVNAAGVAAIGVAITFLISLVAGLFNFLGSEVAGGGVFATGFPLGWELYLLGIGLALLVYATLDHEAGPGYLGGIVLAIFTVYAAVPGEDGPSLIGWPIVLLAVGVAGIGYSIAGARR